MQGVQDLDLVLASLLGLSESAGGLICVMVIFITLSLPILMLAKGQGATYIIAGTGILSMGLGVVIGWMHWSFLLIYIFTLVALISGKVYSVYSGSGGS